MDRSLRLHPGLALHEAHNPGPLNDQGPPDGSIPILFDIGMAAGSHPGPLMVAIPALQWLMPCSMQFAFVVHQKGTALRSEFVIGEPGLAAPESRGEDPERERRRHLQHHASRIAGLNGLHSLVNGPPARALAVTPANTARTRRRRRILLGECFSVFVSTARHNVRHLPLLLSPILSLFLCSALSVSNSHKLSFV
jgi:hypothetical protein